MTALAPDIRSTTHARPSHPARALQRLSRFGRPPRLMGVDVARGIAVIGMIGAHVGVTETFDWARIDTWTDLVHGNSSILFAVVAGISIGLLSGGARRPVPAELPALRLRLVGRGAVVFAIGVLLELLNTGVAVILTVYGVLFVAVIPFLRWSRRRLVIAAALLAVLGPIALATLRIVTNGASGPGLDLVLFGTYPVTVWLALLFAGLALGRTALGRPTIALRLLLGGTVLAAMGFGLGTTAPAASTDGADLGWSGGSSETGLAGSTVDLDGSVCDRYSGFVSCSLPGAAQPVDEESGGPDLAAEVVTALTSATPHSGGTAEILGSGGLAVAVIGACLILVRPFRWVLLPLAALGSMPLSAYSAHVVVILFAVGTAGTTEQNGLWIGMSLALLVAATLWVALLGRGPLERVVARSATAMAGAPRTAPPQPVDARVQEPSR